MGESACSKSEECLCRECEHLPASAEVRKVERFRRIELRRLAIEAIDVQNACNLSGVLMGAHKAACSLRTCGSRSGLGTNEINEHPIMQLWTSKIAHLAGVDHTYPREADERVRSLTNLYIPAIPEVST